MNDESAQYSVVLVSGGMRSHESDWAGLCVAVRGRKLVVKPLAIRVDETARAEATLRPPEKTTTLRIARECPLKTLDISTVMERLTFAPDGVGRVRGEKRSDAPPILGERFRVDLNSAERAMVAGKSPEVMRGEVERREGNHVSETVCSLFEEPHVSESIEPSPREVESESSIDEEDFAFSSPSAHVDERVADSTSPAKEILGDELPEQAHGSQASLEAEEQTFQALDASTPIEWCGLISHLHEQLAKQQGSVKLILNRADIERFLAEITDSKP
jgi:hypothetical protein